mmetsp:Transcript_51758/g.110602  ORF Transcript_51758/g.110602 Transcript_51758/m.110602 type:complete len:203 (+) Transcript_51758:106-714(+)
MYSPCIRKMKALLARLGWTHRRLAVGYGWEVRTSLMSRQLQRVRACTLCDSKTCALAAQAACIARGPVHLPAAMADALQSEIWAAAVTACALQCCCKSVFQLASRLGTIRKTHVLVDARRHWCKTRYLARAGPSRHVGLGGDCWPAEAQESYWGSSYSSACCVAADSLNIYAAAASIEPCGAETFPSSVTSFLAISRSAFHM